MAKDVQKIYSRASKVAADSGLKESNVLLDSLSAHPELIHKMNGYDHKYLSMKIKMDAEMAFHNFGGAIWVDGNVAPYMDAGLIVPQIVVDTFYVDGVAQVGTAYGFTDEFAAGIGIKFAKRHKVESVQITMVNYDNIQDTLEDRYHDVADELFDGRDPRRMSVDQRLGLARALRQRYRLSFRQLSTLVRLPESEIVKYIS